MSDETLAEVIAEAIERDLELVAAMERAYAVGCRKGQEGMRERAGGTIGDWLATAVRMNRSMAEKYAREILSAIPITDL